MEALYVVLGAVLGFVGSIVGSIVVSRRELTRQHRVLMYRELLPAVTTQVPTWKFELRRAREWYDIHDDPGAVAQVAKPLYDAVDVLERAGVVAGGPDVEYVKAIRLVMDRMLGTKDNERLTTLTDELEQRCAEFDKFLRDKIR